MSSHTADFSNQQPPDRGQPQPETAKQSTHQTPRRSGVGRSTMDVTKYRVEIPIQMSNEMVRCDEWDKEGGFDHYLPENISDADVESALDALRKRSLVKTGPDGKPQFTKFQTTPSQIVTPHERSLYEPLIDICKILRSVKLTEPRDPSCIFEQKPDSYTTAETQGANFKVDAHLKLVVSTMPPSESPTNNMHVADLAVPAEYKRDRKDVLLNREQLLGTTTFCMNDDPRRMHIYGITIEDATMAVWYFSRSHSAKSPDFDFTQDCRRYIRIMLSFIFATEEELGYDQTIQRRVDTRVRRLCFVYKVGNHYYKTKKAIFDHRSLCMTGRATRVWEVVEVNSFDDLTPLGRLPVSAEALKDVWLDVPGDGSPQTMTEDQNLEAIFCKLKSIGAQLKEGHEPDGFKLMDEASKRELRQCLLNGEEDWKQYFLIISKHWEGFTSKKVAPGAQADDELFVHPPLTGKPSSHWRADTSRSSISHPTELLPNKPMKPIRHYTPKRQYRAVFKDVCQALHDVPKFDDVVISLSHCVFALQLMFLAGWVHRDISSGNVLCFYGNNGVRGKLADLEYAKLYEPDRTGASDPKTGTAYFMAVEIQKQLPIYLPPKKTRLSTDLLLARFRASKPGVPAAAPVGTNVGRHNDVVHNYEHDMESVFWLLLWTLLARFPCERSALDQARFERGMSQIFQDSSVCSFMREKIFIRSGPLEDFLSQWLAPELARIAELLEALRDALVEGYRDRQLNFSDVSSYSYLYDYLRAVLTVCRELGDMPELLSSHHVTAGTANPAVPTVTRACQVVKRGHGDDDDYIPPAKAGRLASGTTASSMRPRRERQAQSHQEAIKE